jgi:2-polyprenyl-3-methyl-5-hydroxy-6-metoxy-1,4-benzoquinol methylase
MVAKNDLCSEILGMSINYYNDNGQAFFAGTIEVNMSSLYAPFLKYLPQGGAVLDAGCGSGRDALAFKRLGYDVTAFDASPALAKLASKHTGLDVQVHSFTEVEEESMYDGVWACASLLHVPRKELPRNLNALTGALRKNGVLYASFKQGSSTREVGARTFTDMTIVGLYDLMIKVGLQPIQSWHTCDARKGRGHEKWVNIIAIKQ